MKKIILSFALAAFTMVAFAQEHTEGMKNLNIGLGLGGFGVGSAVIPPVNASYEVGLNDNISVGGFVGFAAYKEDFSIVGTSYSWNYTYLMLGARGAYHLQLVDNFDTYGGIMLGYNAGSVKYDGPGNALAEPSFGGLIYGGFVGGRYAFSESFGAYAELGYGLGLLNLGVNLKL